MFKEKIENCDNFKYVFKKSIKNLLKSKKFCHITLDINSLKIRVWDMKFSLIILLGIKYKYFRRTF